MISIKRSKIISAAALAAVLLSPVSVLAEDSVTTSSNSSSSSSSFSNTSKSSNVQERIETKKIERSEAKNQKICDRMIDLSDKVSGKFGEKETNLKTKIDERLAKWTAHMTEKEKKMAQTRANRDSNFEEHFQKLEERATTDEQKKAVADFEATVDVALAARRTAVDAAMKTFQEGVKTAIAGRKTDAGQLAIDFNAARQTAFEKAKTDCAAGASAETIKKNLRADLQAAKSKLQADKKNIDKVGATVTQLSATRRQAVEKAFTDFKATMERARIELRKAFPNG